MLPAAALSAFLCSLVVWPWASPLGVTAGDFGWLVLFGTLQFGLGQLLLTLGLRSVSATRSALISGLETPLAAGAGRGAGRHDLRRRCDRVGRGVLGSFRCSVRRVPARWRGRGK